MVSIEIKNAKVETETINPSKKVGAKQFVPFEKRYQVAYVSLVGSDGQRDAYPTKFFLGLAKDELPHPPGIYTLLAESLYVDRNQNLSLGFLKIKQLQPAASVKAAA